MKYVILIPAYNPDAEFGNFINVLAEQSAPVVVVDDGSCEKSEEYFTMALEKGFAVIRHDGNKGKGQALRTGFAAIAEQWPDYDYVITADCDGQHSLESIQKVAEAAENNMGTLIIGGRFRDDSEVPLRSRLGNGFTRTVFRLATGLKIHDTQTGLRAVPCSIIGKMLELKGDRYEYEMNMLLYLKEWSIPYLEVSISTIYHDNNAGSHFNTFRDSWLIFRQIIKFIGSSVVSFLVDYLLYIVFLYILGRIGGVAYIVPIAFAGARVISGIVNYILNSQIVFKGSSKRAALGYFILWLMILCVGMGGSYLFNTSLGLPKIASKICIDIPLFLASYIVQRELIFKKRIDRK